MSTGNQSPFISVCIPAYKHPEYLKRLLDSLARQTFKDFEVIITDDSPDDSVLELSKLYLQSFPVSYYKNVTALGTPANWNEGIRKAKGAWIKLIHDDDWLASTNSLQDYVEAIQSNIAVDFFFSAFRNVDIKSGENVLNAAREKIVRPASARMRQLASNPVTLLSKNIIGPPSVVIHKNNREFFYDTQLKWLVDIDFYIRYLKLHKVVFIDKPLVNIGINPLQVTKSSSLVPEVEIPEHFSVLEKTGVNSLQNLLVYDAWWRLFRNLKIKSAGDIAVAGYKGQVPRVLKKMISFQTKFPYRVLKFGVISKSLMLASYVVNRM